MITSVSKYLEWVHKSHSLEGPYKDCFCNINHVYYRGHASTSWKLEPSLFRTGEKRHDEHWMLRKANNMLWQELCDCNSDLDKMIRLQHYGLHTRLLDVTFNPLIALFFACQEVKNPDDEQDGIVSCGYTDENNVKVCYAIAEYVFNYETLKINERNLLKICKKYDVRLEELESVHFLSAPFNNPRISIQNGAFLMSPIKQEGEKLPVTAECGYIRNRMEKVFSKQCVIPHNFKHILLDELDYLGFNKATIYADMTNKLQYINEKEDKEWETIDLDLSAASINNY